MYKKIFTLLLSIVLCQFMQAKDFVWFDGKGAITYSVTEAADKVVGVALEMFCGDMEQVTGLQPMESTTQKAKIEIIQLDQDADAAKRLAGRGVPVSKMKTTKEAFHISVSHNRLLVVGSDARGTAYGILELSRLAGVSPWVWWGDSTPERKSTLTVATDYKIFQSPSVEYRGIFLNDEDWSLQPWSWRTFEPTAQFGRIGTRTYKEIFKLLLRLRANMIWPGMHGGTIPFYCVPGLKETADSCAIVIGTSHCEPLMRNNVGEWKTEERGAYNYISNKESVQNYWIERLKEAGQYENFYTLGMRGIHDSNMEGVSTLQEKTDALQQVIYDQRDLLVKYVNKDLSKIPQSFVPYKEVLQIMENGLQLPEDISLVWCDDNYGYMTRLSDTEQQKRSGGAGVYYHLSYWGRPHDYLWLSTTQPGLVYSEMKQAYDHNVRKLWIVNVHDPRTASYDLELFLDMAWNINSVSPSTLNAHQLRWLCREFGDKAGEQLLPAMLEYYRLCGIRKPEFMGWNQVELDEQEAFKMLNYTRGWSPVADTEFSLTEFGGELDRYLEAYANVKGIVAKAESLVPEGRKDTFFSFIKYPVYGAAAMSTKILEAQRARSLAGATYDANRWKRGQGLMTACAKSTAAYMEIRNLTEYYNDTLANGKWRHLMCAHPRDLYVFYAPTLPIGLTDNEVAHYVTGENKPSMPLQELNDDSFVAKNACDYISAGNGVQKIQALGHSMSAVALPKGESLVYEFESPRDGEAILRTAVIPTQPNDTGDIRFSVSIDGGEAQICSFKEGFRTESWKRNVERGQAIRETGHTLSKGKHTLRITALDNHVIVDQWMIDFKPSRKFYVFPLEPSYE